MRVDLVDPPAYSPPYDHALASALVAEGAHVRLFTSRFAYGTVPDADNYQRHEYFYRLAIGSAASRVRRVTKATEHVPDMLAYRLLTSNAADVVHFQWLTAPALDLRLLPSAPVVLTIHDPLRRARPHGVPGAHGFERVAAVIVHSEYARTSVIESHALEPSKVHVIRHGALGPALPVGGQRAGDGTDSGLPAELRDDGAPVVLSFGLLRPYKGLETLLAAWHGTPDAQLWVVGRPMMDVDALAATAPAGVQILPRFVSESEQAALFARADVVVLPYERGERFGFSGVLATALGHGKAIVLSDVGGFAEVGALGAARTVTPGDSAALREVLDELVGDADARDALAAAAREAATGVFSWERAARETIALYEKILA
jgi:glycosyltransferase involved in cell wall biosynthesis